MKYGEEHIENMDGQDPTDNNRMPEMYLEFSEQELKPKQERNKNHAKY